MSVHFSMTLRWVSRQDDLSVAGFVERYGSRPVGATHLVGSGAPRFSDEHAWGGVSLEALSGGGTRGRTKGSSEPPPATAFADAVGSFTLGRQIDSFCQVAVTDP
jgi:hypothetical protein